MPASTKYYLLHLQLKDIEPPIWREVVVASSATLAQLHRIIQILMGWYNYHLYMFRIDEQEFSPTDPDEDLYGAEPGSVRTRLSSHLRRQGAHIDYVYDFGDGWEVHVTLKRIYAAMPTGALPFCVGGERHGPLEDSGGPPGYEELLAILADPQHEEYEHMVQWASADFNSEEFSVEQANEQLRAEFRRRKR